MDNRRFERLNAEVMGGPDIMGDRTELLLHAGMGNMTENGFIDTKSRSLTITANIEIPILLADRGRYQHKLMPVGWREIGADAQPCPPSFRALQKSHRDNNDIRVPSFILSGAPIHCESLNFFRDECPSVRGGKRPPLTLIRLWPSMAASRQRRIIRIALRPTAIKRCLVWLIKISTFAQTLHQIGIGEE